MDNSNSMVMYNATVKSGLGQAMNENSNFYMYQQQEAGPSLGAPLSSGNGILLDSKVFDKMPSQCF